MVISTLVQQHSSGNCSGTSIVSFKLQVLQTMTVAASSMIMKGRVCKVTMADSCCMPRIDRPAVAGLSANGAAQPRRESARKALPSLKSGVV